MKKISIIVPNYNNQDFLYDCLESITSQDYPEKEIIVVDDGSTDDSIKKVEKFINEHKSDDIKVFSQPNLNAAIARNKGLENATGDYVLFLDSDDFLEKDILSKMVAAYQDYGADLVVGGYERIDGEGRHLKYERLTDEVVTKDIMDVFSKLIDESPVPSNKLYDLNLIRKNNLWWGNVRIGQDLNFYFKYLSLCKKVTIVNWDIYQYRLTANSMTRSYDFRIFDIVNVFEDIKKFYAKVGKASLYDFYIPVQALKHFYMQMTKQRFYASRKTRMLIVEFFSINEQKLDYTKCKNRDIKFEKNLKKFHRLYRLRWILTSEWFKKRCERKERRKSRERK